MRVFFLGLLLILISWWNIRKLILKETKRELYVFSGLMLLAAYLSIGSLVDWYIPNPTNGLKLIFQPVQEWINKLLGSL